MSTPTDPGGCPQCGGRNVTAMTILHLDGVAKPSDPPAPPKPPPVPAATKAWVGMRLAATAGLWYHLGRTSEVRWGSVLVWSPEWRPLVVLLGLVAQVALLGWLLIQWDHKRHALEKQHQKKLHLHRQATAWWSLMKVSLCHHLIWVDRDHEGVQVPGHEPVYGGLDQHKRSWDLAESLATRSLAAAEAGKGAALDWRRLWDEEPVTVHG